MTTASHKTERQTLIDAMSRTIILVKLAMIAMMIGMVAVIAM